MLDRLLTIEQVSEQLQLKPKTIHGLVRDGKLSCVQVTPRERRFLPEQIEEFIRSRITPGPTLVDKKLGNRLPSPAKSSRGGERNSGDLVRAQLREEMRSWQ